MLLFTEHLLITSLVGFRPTTLVPAARRHIPVLSTAASFEDSLAAAPSLCQSLEAGSVDDEAASSLGEMLQTTNGARGFFVNYLSGQYSVADAQEPPSALISALETAPEPATARLLLMNVVMPAATVLAHQRNGNDDGAEGSAATSRRAATIVRSSAEAQAAVLREETKALRFAALQLLAQSAGMAALQQLATVTVSSRDPPSPDDVARWAGFCTKWGYDAEQLEALLDALDTLEPPEEAAE